MDLPITIITVVSNLFLGFLTYFKNPKNTTHKLLFLLTIIIAAWAATNYFSLHSSNLEATLFWIRVILSIVTPMWTIVFLLVVAFPYDRLNINRTFLASLLLYTLATSVIALSPYMFTGITTSGNNIQPIPGPGILLHALLAISSLIASSIILVKKYIQRKGLEKTQIKFFLLGTIITFTSLIVTNFILVNVFKTSLLVVFGPFFTLILVGSISYAIIKHRLLDIRLIVARAVAFLLLLLIFGAIYSLAVLFLGSTFLNIQFSVEQIIFYGLTTLIVAFSFQPLRRALEKITDNIFYKNRYDTSKLLYDLALIMAATLLLEDLMHRLLKTLLMEMKIARGAFILTDEDRVYRVAHEGYQTPPEFDEEKIKLLLSQHQMLIFEELPEGELKEILRNLNITVVCYLRVKSGHIGLLLLGEKQSGDIYTSKDIDVLEIFAPEAAVAIQNAQSYEEIRRFSVTLQQEVDRATKDLQVANEKLQALDKLKDEFLSLASHELRTPMGAVKSYLWMVLNKAETLDTDKKKLYMDRAYNSTVRLIALVNDMLNVSRIESGRIKLSPKIFSVVDLAKELVEELNVKAKEKSITLSVTDAPVPSVFADSDKVREVIINLIGNALKFTDNNGRITVSFSKVGEIVTTHVADTGRGISREDLGKLFTKFGRLENSLSSVAEVEGTGLGLYICKQFIELSGGKVTVTSELGKGSTFSFSLPTHSASSGQAHSTSSEQAAVTPQQTPPAQTTSPSLTV